MWNIGNSFLHPQFQNFNPLWSLFSYLSNWCSRSKQYDLFPKNLKKKVTPMDQSYNHEIQQLMYKSSWKKKKLKDLSTWYILLKNRFRYKELFYCSVTCISWVYLTSENCEFKKQPNLCSRQFSFITNKHALQKILMFFFLSLTVPDSHLLF